MKTSLDKTLRLLGLSLFSLSGLAFGLSVDWAEKAVQDIRKERTVLRWPDQGPQLRQGWPLNHTIRPVEEFFGDPLKAPVQGTKWATQVEDAAGPKALFEVAYALLGSTTPAVLSVSPRPLRRWAIPDKIPPEFHPVLNELVKAIAQAQPWLTQAVESLSSSERQDLLSLYEWPVPTTGKVQQEISSRRIKKKYAAMKKFDQEALLKAGQILLAALEEQQTILMGLSEASPAIRARWTTPVGDVLFSGIQDNSYTPDDLKNVTLLIDLGGQNTYQGAVAAALDNQIRVAIDLGSQISVQSTQPAAPTAGAGVFGIGIFSLPKATQGVTVQSGSFGQGLGLGGIGALLIQGPAFLKGARYVQGAGVFGVGLLQVKDGPGSTYWAERNGQGLGMPRGVGVFSHAGDGADIKGGLVQPDPREPQGAVSLCQGVGFGRRAYTGGGAGIAVLKGNKISVLGSYFAQGCGYWHGFGLFRLNGNDNLVQARRYDQGSGVHYAFGHFQVWGDRNRVLNWGVGPSYGWDVSLGSAFIKGSENEVQVDWASFMGSIGSQSYSYIEGDRNILKTPDYAKGLFYRRRLAYSVHLIRGQGNIMKRNYKVPYRLSEPGRFMPNPWGVFHASELEFRPHLTLAKPVWPPLVQEKVLERESINLQAKIQSATQAETRDKVFDLLDVAAAFSLDKGSPRQAFKRLLTLKQSEIPFLVEALEPQATDQLIWLMPLLSAHGPRITQPILSTLDDQALQKRAILINQLSYQRPSLVIPALLTTVTAPATTPEEETLRFSAIGTLGNLLNRDTGQNPGTRGLLVALQDSLSQPRSGARKKKVQDLLTRIRVNQAYQLLSLSREPTVDDRLAVYDLLPEDFIANTLSEKGAETLLTLLLADKKGLKKRVDEELAQLEQLETTLRQELRSLVKSTHTRSVKVGLTYLGQIAHPEDLSVITPLLALSTATVRESLALALGRLGEAAHPFIKQTLMQGPVADRQLMMAVMPHAVSAKALPLLKMGLADPDPLVRLTAVSAVEVLPPALTSYKKKLKRLLKKILKKETDPSVRFAATVFSSGQ